MGKLIVSAMQQFATCRLYNTSIMIMAHLQPARRLADGRRWDWESGERRDSVGVGGQAKGGEGKGAKMRQVAHFARAQTHKGNDGMSVQSAWNTLSHLIRADY